MSTDHELQHLREQIDLFMERHPQSPLDRDQKRTFQGLSYYDHNPDLVFEVELIPSQDDEVITMETSTGDAVDYRRLGGFSFEVNGETATLTVFVDQYGRDLFLPFKDATNGDETYGAGRYMDSHRPALEHIRGRRYRVDFNYAYNPYCAYSPYFSCPLPPRENWLSVPIRAGEMAFEDVHHNG